MFTDFITEFDMGDGDQLIGELCTGSSCRSCRVPLPLGHIVCRLCANHIRCPGCRHWQPPTLFSNETLVCETCVKKKLHDSTKFAFGGIVREEPIITTEVDVDIGEFLRAHTQAITDIIQRALNQHS